MAEIGRVKLSIFTWKKARLNRVILQVLSEHGPLTPYELVKRIRAVRGFRHTRYSVVNRRVRALEEEGFLEVVRVKEAQKAPQRSFVYRLTLRAHLAIVLDKIDLDRFLRVADEDKISVLLEVLS